MRHLTHRRTLIFLFSLLTTACQPMEAWEDKLADSWVSSYRTIDGVEGHEAWSLCDDESDDGLGWMRWPARDEGDHTPKTQYVSGDVHLTEARTDSVILVVKGEHQASDGKRTNNVTREEILWTDDWEVFELGDDRRSAHIFPCPVDLPD